jgi:hypothetical protein
VLERVGVAEVEEVDDAVGVDPHGAVLLFLRFPARGAGCRFLALETHAMPMTKTLILFGEGRFLSLSVCTRSHALSLLWGKKAGHTGYVGSFDLDSRW